MQSIQSVIGARLRNKSKRKERADGAHVALVIECGGMRGVVAGGFVRVFCEAGMIDAVDSVHGASAGACAGAYFLGNQPFEGRSIYLEDINNRRVVNPYRIWSRPCMVDTDFIVDHVISKVRPLDAKRILAEPGLFNVVTTSVANAAPVVCKNFVDRDEVLMSLKASLRVPGPREPGVWLRGERHIDGGVSAPIPIFSALNSGATHILVIGTQLPKDYIESDKDSILEARMIHMFYGERMMTIYRSAQGAGRDPRTLGKGKGAEILMLTRNANSPVCKWHTIDKTVLLQVESDATAIAMQFINTSNKTQ